MKFDRDYFENGIEKGVSGYEHYRWMPERTRKEVRALINVMGIDPHKVVLDFGCSKGYWVKALREYNVDACGVDISEYAIENCDKSVERYITTPEDMPIEKFDYIVSRNTLEHLPEEELIETLKDFYNKTNHVFFSVPLCEKNGGKYIIPIAEKDVTHVIRWTLYKWVQICGACGWEVEALNQIEGIHDGWSEYKNGNGFFILSKIPKI